MRSVKLDSAGRVTGVATGPPRPGWLALPEHVSDPQNHRVVSGEFVLMTVEERQHRDHDHYPPPQEPAARAHLRQLRQRGVTDSAQLADAIIAVLDTL